LKSDYWHDILVTIAVSVVVVLNGLVRVQRVVVVTTTA
jgi:hypothetical protein